MLLCISLLTACPHHHHIDCNHMIETIHSFEEVDFDQTDVNTLVIFDVDDTLIFDLIYKGTVREQIFKKLKQRLPSKTLDFLCGIIYNKRQPVLVEPVIAAITKNLKNRHISTIALTSAQPGKYPGLKMRFGDWRIQDLVKTGIVFNDPFKKTITFNQSKGKLLLKSGIIFTADHDKGEILKKVFDKLGCHFNKIVFFDDKKENVISVSKMAEDLSIAFKGYIYKGAEFAPRPKLDKKTEEYRFSVLEKEHIWLSTKEAQRRLG